MSYNDADCNLSKQVKTTYIGKQKKFEEKQSFPFSESDCFCYCFFFHHGVRAYIIHIRNILKFLEGKTAIEKKIKESKKEEKESEYFS